MAFKKRACLQRYVQRSLTISFTNPTPLKRHFCMTMETKLKLHPHHHQQEPLIIDGKKLANSVLQNIPAYVAHFEQCYHRQPGLAVILIKYKNESMVYTQLKSKKAAHLGIASYDYYFEESEVSKESLIDLITQLNADNRVDGILLQLPLPPSLDMHSNEIVDQISPLKDVDGLTTQNQGILTKYGRALITDNMHNIKYDALTFSNCTKYMNFPCTPLAVLYILEYLEQLNPDKYALESKNIVVIGRSCLVGTPLSMMLSGKNATVTLCHSYTDRRPNNLDDICSRADIIVVAAGSPNLVTSKSIKSGCVVIDVGTNVTQHKEGERMRVIGDAAFHQIKHLVSAITPVPGGVGPLTVAMLFYNTIRAAKCRQLQLNPTDTKVLSRL